MAKNHILKLGQLLHSLPRPIWQVSALLLGATAACGQAATKPVDTSPHPFVVHEIATFSSPWAMAFLTGSGRPLLDAALLTERGGKLWLSGSDEMTRTGENQYRAGEEWSSPRLRFADFVDGRPQTLIVDGNRLERRDI